eukprot:COSAG01_NODE_20233_length_964_cov_1.657803_1_plen_220_part_00
MSAHAHQLLIFVASAPVTAAAAARFVVRRHDVSDLCVSTADIRGRCKGGRIHSSHSTGVSVGGGRPTRNGAHLVVSRLHHVLPLPTGARDQQCRAPRRHRWGGRAHCPAGGSGTGRHASRRGGARRGRRRRLELWRWLRPGGQPLGEVRAGDEGPDWRRPGGRARRGDARAAGKLRRFRRLDLARALELGVPRRRHQATERGGLAAAQPLWSLHRSHCQ